MAFDVRGTLIDPPRSKNIERSLTNRGFTAALAAEIDRIAPDFVKSKYSDNTTVTNWTLVTVLEVVQLLRERGVHLSCLDIDAIVTEIEREYIDFSVALVGDIELHRFVEFAEKLAITVLFIPDGPSWREEAVLRRLFPRTLGAGVQIFASDTAGCNKLGLRFYSNLASSLGIDPSSILVIGDRYDKDVSKAVEAGAQSVLIASSVPEGWAAERTFQSLREFMTAFGSGWPL
jgi:FMN phosphatase YigB (HAD superfamily)